MKDTDRSRAKRAAEAMLEMKTLDIAGLESAYGQRPGRDSLNDLVLSVPAAGQFTRRRTARPDLGIRTRRIVLAQVGLHG